MHPDIMRQLAADHIRELITEVGEARRAREARRAQRRRLVAQLRRSTRMAGQQPGSREIMDAVEPGQSFAVIRDGHRVAEPVPLRQRRRPA
jgi:hypothetical protein